MSSRIGRQKKLSSSNISNASSTSSQRINLRTIMKGRGSQRGFIQNDLQMHNKSRNENQHEDRLSVSASFKSSSRLSDNHNKHQSLNKNQFHSIDTLNCEQQLLGKQDHNKLFLKLEQNLARIQARAQELIKRKICKKQSNSSKLIWKKGKSQQLQIQNLIEQLKHIKPQNLQQLRQLMDRKITILQSLIAEASTQSQMLKNHFFTNTINCQQKLNRSNLAKSKNNIKEESRLIKDKIIFQSISKGQRSKTQIGQSMYLESIQKSAYHPPKQNEYETYRYRAKQYKANLQPFPRSSYKSEYLVYNPKKLAPIKSLDNYAKSGKHRQTQSTYTKDYQKIKADLINYKELDSYKNKYKNLNISYSNRNRNQYTAQQFQKSMNYIDQQRKFSYLNDLNSSKRENQRLISRTQPMPMSTESKRQFQGHKQVISNTIKNRRLNNLKYAYKTLAQK